MGVAPAFRRPALGKRRFAGAPPLHPGGDVIPAPLVL